MSNRTPPKRPPKRKTAPRERGPVLRFLALLVPPVRELAERWQLLGWLVASVVLFRLTMAPTYFWPLGFVCLVPWFWALRGTKPRMAFWISWIYGFLLGLALYGWLTSLSRFNPFIYLGIPLLAIFQGLYLAVAGAGIVSLSRRLRPTVALLAALPWWAGLEWLRSIGDLGNPYALLGHTVAHFLPLAQTTSLGGVVLLSAVVLATNLALMEALAARQRNLVDAGVVARTVGSLLVPVVLSVWGLGVMSSTRAGEEDGIPVRVAMLQPNVDQDDKFTSYTDPDPVVRWRLSTAFTKDLFELMDELEPGTLDLVVVPESALTQLWFDVEAHEAQLQAELRERAARLGATLVVGASDTAFRREDGSLTEYVHEADPQAYVEAYVSLYVFRPEDEEFKVAGDYRKIHLMPFGETVPVLNLIPGVAENIVQIGEFLRGDRTQPPIFIDVDPQPDDPTSELVPVHIGPTICFEDMFAYLHNRLVRRGVQLFVNSTNNAWFDPGLGSRHHFDHARLRAVETRRPVLFCTNTGVTAVVSGTGEIVERLPRFERTTLQTTVMVPRDGGVTLYARVGDWFGMLGLLGSLALFAFLNRERWRRGSRKEGMRNPPVQG